MLVIYNLIGSQCGISIQEHRGLPEFFDPATKKVRVSVCLVFKIIVDLASEFE